MSIKGNPQIFFCLNTLWSEREPHFSIPSQTYQWVVKNRSHLARKKIVMKKTVKMNTEKDPRVKIPSLLENQNKNKTLDHQDRSTIGIN